MTNKTIPCALAHFHRVDSNLWLAVDSLLWQLVKSRLDAAANVFTIRFTLDEAQLLTDFQSEMALSYVHPRRDAMHMLFPSFNPFVQTMPCHD